MKRSNTVVRLGIDLGKSRFHLFGVDSSGQVVLRRVLRRAQLVSVVARLEPCLIGMEACAGSHHWARTLSALGHEVKLISPQFVAPYVKGNKHDFNDAEAICEAVARPRMRFVAIKTVEQQEVQALHRLRGAAIKWRTGLANQLRGLLGEYGLVLPGGLGALRRGLPELLEAGDNGLPMRLRGWLAEQTEQLRELDRQIAGYDRQIRALAREQEACQRIGAVPGIGPQAATALVAAYGQGREFDNGRQLAASLGLVPRQHSTGGKPRLLGISKRGDTYLRTLLIHGARAVVARAPGKDDALSRWLQRLIRERGKNKAAVALANKNARIIWALLAKGESYRAPA